MLKLTEKRFADALRSQPETGMGYWIATTILRDGRRFPQTVITGGVVTQVRNHNSIPFKEADIDRFEVTHDKWD